MQKSVKKLLMKKFGSSSWGHGDSRRFIKKQSRKLYRQELKKNAYDYVSK